MTTKQNLEDPNIPTLTDIIMPGKPRSDSNEDQLSIDSDTPSEKQNATEETQNNKNTKLSNLENLIAQTVKDKLENHLPALAEEITQEILKALVEQKPNKPK